jgi:hypothetical protein
MPGKTVYKKLLYNSVPINPLSFFPQGGKVPSLLPHWWKEGLVVFTHKIIMLIFSKFIFSGRLLYSIMTLVFFAAATGCIEKVPVYTENNKGAKIYPDYTAITIPPNIAPLNFIINENAEKYLVRFSSGNFSFIVTSGNGKIRIPRKKWKSMISGARGSEYNTDIFVKRTAGWEKFISIRNKVAIDSIDSYIAYRLIEPGYETWNRMGIYQRDLEDFRESPVMLNSYADGNCINCHSFCMNSNEKMMFHVRGSNGGTVLYNNGTISKVNTKIQRTISAGVYPQWHPGGDLIAFSVNNIVQSFHAVADKRIEVYDTLSDIVIYDTKKNILITPEALSSPRYLETFPAWSPEGRKLYFCRARKMPAEKYDSIHYDLMSISFDPEKMEFEKPETVIHAADSGKSISFPRISPDGKYLLYCLSDYGNFSIWHKESDLYMLNLLTGEVLKPPVNSSRSESYHSWSSTGRWFVFSSRRDDGLYTRPYFSYFDNDGNAHKPFMLPQEDPDFYSGFMKSFNIPEFVKGRIKPGPREFRAAVKSSPVSVAAGF